MTTNDTRPAWPFQHITKMSAHPRGQWVKKIRGKIRYFGAWSVPDPENAKAKAAVEKYLALMQDTDLGTRPSEAPTQSEPTQRLNVDTLVNGYMGDKLASLTKGELTPRQFAEYRKLGDLILTTFGKPRLVEDLKPSDFATLRSKLPGGPVRLGNEIVWSRSFFRWALDHHGFAVRYGNQFDKPSRRIVRKAVKRKEIFSATDIQTILKHASGAMKAMVLLGINGGFGQTDCAMLPKSAVDFGKELVEFDRPKTGVRRIVPLWPETITALKDYVRPSLSLPELYFVTRWGNPWVHDAVHKDLTGIVKKAIRCDAVDLEFDKIQKATGMGVRGFYLLRHTFRTIADSTGDLNAIRAIMGHAFPGMDEFYLHLHAGGINRLQRVTDHVRAWLFGSPSTNAPKPRRKSRKTK